MHDLLAVRTNGDRFDFWRAARPSDQSNLYAPGISLEQVLEAAAVSGMVTGRGDEWLITATSSCADLTALLAEMLEYLDAEGRPTAWLRQIQEAALATSDVRLRAASPMAFAWLDVVIRHDLSEAARAIYDPWHGDAHTLDVAAVRRRRIGELLDRLSGQRQPEEASFKMAASQRNSQVRQQTG